MSAFRLNSLSYITRYSRLQSVLLIVLIAVFISVLPACRLFLFFSLKK